MREGLHCSAWDYLASRAASRSPAPTSPAAAGIYMAAQMEAGHSCPITMTNAAVPALLPCSPSCCAAWLPKILSREVRPELRAGWQQKSGVTIGMGMTEKQGGTDVRANTTTADAARGNGGPARPIASPATNGSCRRPCATPSWCWRRRQAGSPAS